MSLHDQLKEKIQELEQIRKVREYITSLQDRLVQETRALSEMQIVLQKEQQDVETLEREGLYSMFYKFLGDREERLDKERQEYLKAALKFNEIFRSVELIRYELNLLTEKAKNEDAVAAQIEVLIQQREAEILNNDPQVSLELKGIYAQTDKLNKYSVEVEEAYNAGNEALQLIIQTEQHLVEAQGWGQRDMWGGRYHRPSQMKHQSVDLARQAAYQSKYALLRFTNELRDVYSNVQLQVNMEIEEFGRFAEIFFDNLITDWMVQQKINKSLLNVSQTRQNVSAIMIQLDTERGHIKMKLLELEKKRKEVVVAA